MASNTGFNVVRPSSFSLSATTRAVRSSRFESSGCMWKVATLSDQLIAHALSCSRDLLLQYQWATTRRRRDKRCRARNGDGESSIRKASEVNTRSTHRLIIL